MEVPEKSTAEHAESAKKHYDKKKNASPHRVLGNEAARRTDWDRPRGLVVDCEITDWPRPPKIRAARVVEVLGYEDDFGVDVEIVIRKHHLPHRFPAIVIDEARASRLRNPCARTEPPPRFPRPAHRHDRR